MPALSVLVSERVFMFQLYTGVLNAYSAVICGSSRSIASISQYNASELSRKSDVNHICHCWATIETFGVTLFVKL